jgi:predicted phosphodiesterase
MPNYGLTELAIKFREKHGWDMPNMTLARIMYKKNPLKFKSLDSARSTLRAIEGKSSKSAKVINKLPERPKNPYSLPESSKLDRKPYILPLACNDILVISDLHIPYHDNEAIQIALDYGKANKVNTIFINGDLMDFYQQSKFEKDLNKRSTKHEFDCTKQFLQYLRAEFPEASIYWLKGNHCIRYEKWLQAKAFEIFDDPYYHLEERLRLNEERITILDDRLLVKAGKLSIAHGHHIMKGFFSPVNSARGAWMKAKQSVLIGHVHKVSQHPEVDLDGNVFSCWSTGCLSELKPDYSPLVSNYQLGFAHVIVDKDKTYTVRNMQIINGKIH